MFCFTCEDIIQYYQYQTIAFKNFACSDVKACENDEVMVSLLLLLFQHNISQVSG